MRGIQNPRMSLIRLHGVICKTSLKFYVYYTEYARLFKTVCTNKMHFRTHVKITRWWEVKQQTKQTYLPLPHHLLYLKKRMQEVTNWELIQY